MCRTVYNDKFFVPDYKIYKVENAPQLLKVQKDLAKLGLKDPWLRNEVWRYNPAMYGTIKYRVYATFFRGIIPGGIAAVLTVLGTNLYDSMYPDPDAEHYSSGH